MQNLAFRVPAVFINNSQPVTGGTITTTTQASSSRHVYRFQSGYTGKRSKTRPLPNNSYFLRIEDYQMSHTYDHVNLSNNNREWGGGPCLSSAAPLGRIFFLPTFDALDASLSALALDRLSDKVRGNLDVSIDLAEAGKTAKMFRVIDQAVEYTKVFKRKYGLLKSAGNAWLQYTYGIKPLLGTIYGIADENLRVVINKTEKHTGRASGKFNPTSITVPTIWGDYQNPVISSNLKRSWTYGVDLRSDQHDLARWSSLNPLSIAWELTPFSFVADWFLNIGGYLRNYETSLLYANKFRSGYRTRLTVGDVTWKYPRTVLSGFKNVNDSFWGNCRITIIERSPLTSYPAPRFPSFEAHLGSSRLLSAAALLGTLLGRR